MIDPILISIGKNYELDMKAQSVWGRENPKGLTDGKLNLVDLAFEF
jgi:hypothetical protein